MSDSIKIRQIRGLAGKPWKKRLIVKTTLGLRGIGHEVCRTDSPSIRGAVRKVQELVQIIGSC
jgi:ribosomal protein L30